MTRDIDLSARSGEKSISLRSHQMSWWERHRLSPSACPGQHISTVTFEEGNNSKQLKNETQLNSTPNGHGRPTTTRE